MRSQTSENGVVTVRSGLLGTTHGFTTRLGGVSTGVYSSLNLGENRGDDPENVRENYRRLSDALSLPEERVFTKQVMGSAVRAVTMADSHELFKPLPFEGDGLVTDTPGLPIFIFVADCIPILFHDPVRRAIGAAHAGWRGTVRDVAGETVRALTAHYASRPCDIRAAIGPGIGQCCFETGRDVPEAVRQILGDDAERFIRPASQLGKSLVDLKGINRALLLRAGLLLENVDVSEECTYCLHGKYWSHRFTGGIRGSQAAVIMLEDGDR